MQTIVQKLIVLAPISLKLVALFDLYWMAASIIRYGTIISEGMSKNPVHIKSSHY